MIALLEPLFQGDWAAYGNGVSCAPAPADAIRLDHLLAQPDRLEHILRLHARHLGSDDLRPVTVAWALDYFWLLMPSFVAAATLLRHRLPMAPEQVALTVDADGHPLHLYLPHQGQAMPDSPVEQRYDEFIWRHVQALIQALAPHGRVALRLLWGNATRYLSAVLDQIMLVEPACAADRQALLFERSWPDGRPNPLFGPLRSIRKPENGRLVNIELHRECCLCYLLPGQEYCSACPLTLENRRLLKAGAGSSND